MKIFLLAVRIHVMGGGEMGIRALGRPIVAA
jgi:hypothetical protein